MKLKTSLFKKGLIISDLKRFWWISALYTFALFFVIPFNHYVQKFTTHSQNAEWIKKTIEGELTFNGGSSQYLLLVVPVIISVLVFSYMHKSRSASLYQSLPLTRAALYLNSVISSLILFVVPLLFTTLIMFILNWFSYLSVYYTTKLIFTWLLYSLLFGLMYMAMGIFVGMFTGNSIAQLAFIYILNILPMFLIEFVRLNIKGLLFGFYTFSNSNFYDKMPMAMQFNAGSDQFSITVIIVYILVTIALLVGGLFAFKLRRPETAGDIITFRPVRPIFIYGAVACATLLSGYYCMQIAYSSFAFAILGYFISSLVSYVVVQMIINKSIRILHTYKGYIGFALILVVLALGVKFDVFGYVNNIPNPDEVEETYIGYNLYWWENKDNSDFDIKKYGNSDNTNVYKDPKNIENVTKLHKLIVDNRSINGNTEYVAYKLKNGKRIIRYYTIDSDLYSSVLAPIYESTEYKENRYPILHQEVDALNFIRISDSRSQKNAFILSDKSKLENFKVAIRKDIQKLTYQNPLLEFQRILCIDISDTKDNSITYMVNSNYTNTLNWLKQEGIYDKIVVKPEEVDAITLQAMKYTFDYHSVSGRSTSSSVKITDKAIIKEILELSIDAAYSNKGISYSVVLEKGTDQYFSNFSMSFDDKISSELKSYLNKMDIELTN